MTVIAVGGGKGGVGRTLVATGIAVFLAQIGRKVLLVDAHPAAPQLARMLGVVPPDDGLPPWAVPAVKPGGFETVVPNLHVLPSTTELGALPGVVTRRPQELVQSAGVDVLVVDLGAGIGHGVVDSMLAADVPVLVTTAEPASVEAVHRWIRSAYARSLARAFKGHPVELAALDQAMEGARGAPRPVRLAEALSKLGDFAGETAWRTLHAFQPRLVVNASRSRADLDLGEAMGIVARQQHGVALEYAGHLEFDDAVVLAARRRRPILVDAPGAKASRNLERIARRLATADGLPRAATPPALPGPPAPPTHYDTLVVDPGASDEEIRRAYRRLRDIYGAESLAAAGVLTDAENAAVHVRIEEARDVLLDPARRRPYDLSVMRTGPDGAAHDAQEPQETLRTEPPAALLARLTPDTEFTGDLLREIREAYGVDLKDVAARTKISVANLRAIESETFQQLPAPVYLRGFVVEVAKFFKLDVEQVVRTYMRRHRRATVPEPATRRR